MPCVLGELPFAESRRNVRQTGTGNTHVKNTLLSTLQARCAAPALAWGMPSPRSTREDADFDDPWKVTDPWAPAPAQAQAAPAPVYAHHQPVTLQHLSKRRQPLLLCKRNTRLFNCSSHERMYCTLSRGRQTLCSCETLGNKQAMLQMSDCDRHLRSIARHARSLGFVAGARDDCA